MTEATLSSKNQIVIPREAREALRVKAGDRLLAVAALGTLGPEAKAVTLLVELLKNKLSGAGIRTS